MNYKSLLILLATLISLPAKSAINSLQISQSTISPGCLEYRIKGTCFWLFCSMWGCKVRTSVKVHHYIPDLVVSTFSNTGQNPWKEVALLGRPNSSAQSGGDTNNRTPGDKTKLRFKEAEVFGHPGGTIFSNFASGSGYICKSGATAYQPYFLSTLDILGWRFGIPETVYPAALIPGMRELGVPGDLWGNLYPRIGAISQYHDYKAAGLIAQRAADIVTNTGQSHIYKPHRPGRKDGYWPPPPVQEGDRSTHKWQMLYPQMERHCAIFPDQSTANSYGNKQSIQSDYVFALWQPYSCCKRRGQRFLYSIDFF